MVQIPTFPECKHPIIAALTQHTDQELLTLFQRQPEAGQYFLAIFCRYSPIVYTLIQHSARSPVQANYLFALTWRHIHHELRGLDLRAMVDQHTPETPDNPGTSAHQALAQRHPTGSMAPGNTDNEQSTPSLQNWLINVTAVCINTAQLPATESIHYALPKASPPLWCYLEQSLSQLPPLQRLAILLGRTFHWSHTRIAAHLQAEGEAISPAEVEGLLAESQQALTENLPEDIQTIYCGELQP